MCNIQISEFKQKRGSIVTFFKKKWQYTNKIIFYLVMTVILQTIDYLKFRTIEDYVQYNEDKVGYVIEIIDNDNV